MTYERIIRSGNMAANMRMRGRNARPNLGPVSSPGRLRYIYRYRYNDNDRVWRERAAGVSKSGDGREFYPRAPLTSREKRTDSDA